MQVCRPEIPVQAPGTASPSGCSIEAVVHTAQPPSSPHARRPHPFPPRSRATAGLLLAVTALVALVGAPPAQAGPVSPWRDDWVTIRLVTLQGSAPAGGAAGVKVTVTNTSPYPLGYTHSTTGMPSSDPAWQSTATDEVPAAPFHWWNRPSPRGIRQCNRKWPTIEAHGSFSYTCTVEAGSADHDVILQFGAHNPAGLDPFGNHYWTATTRIVVDPIPWVLV